MAVKELPNLNVVIIGHVDTGKSTTCGQLMANCGRIDPRILEKYEKESSEMGKGSFKYAWVMDKLVSERERGITIENSLKELFTKNKKITIIDAPGHRDFIKNMISGASQADAAILMVSGAKGEFESGISETGQTREHALLGQTLGIRNFVVCVNKMDTTSEKSGGPFDEKRYNEVKGYMKDFLLKLKFREKNLSFVPISGFHGDNVAERSDRSPWYKGDVLVDVLDKMQIPKRPTDKPLRLPIQSKYKIPGIGTVASGRVETGVMKPGETVVFEPGALRTEVKSIEMHHSALEQAQPGDNVGFNVKSVPYKDIRKGMVVGSAKNKPPLKAASFEAQVIIVNHNGIIKPNYSPVVHVHAAHVTCKMTKIDKVMDRRTGKAVPGEKQEVKKDQSAMVTFEPEKPLVVEAFSEFAPLGRFSIRDSKVTVGVGVIKKVVFIQADK